eukprot:CAMPEP_0194329238 /NCGR_PEP_ID=MMETSP0171-20130528/47569_1 /TAXON_ID=218684 /ORGANISM="Corethron pennatum, Strain L29A3" /LENGTH=784 /DNA_ID=CAMNT_0039089907 /DNA_START=25 /DNA_END=2376 /DNA_ORIENTATION=+
MSLPSQVAEFPSFLAAVSDDPQEHPLHRRAASANSSFFHHLPERDSSHESLATNKSDGASIPLRERSSSHTYTLGGTFDRAIHANDDCVSLGVAALEQQEQRREACRKWSETHRKRGCKSDEIQGPGGTLPVPSSAFIAGDHALLFVDPYLQLERSRWVDDFCLVNRRGFQKGKGLTMEDLEPPFRYVLCRILRVSKNSEVGTLGSTRQGEASDLIYCCTRLDTEEEVEVKNVEHFHPLKMGTTGFTMAQHAATSANQIVSTKMKSSIRLDLSVTPPFSAASGAEVTVAMSTPPGGPPEISEGNVEGGLPAAKNEWSETGIRKLRKKSTKYYRSLKHYFKKNFYRRHRTSPNVVLASFDSFREEFSNIEHQLQNLDSSNEEHRQYGKDISEILQLCLRHIKEFSDSIEGQHQGNPSGGAVQWSEGSARVTNESKSTCIKSLKKIIRKLKVSIQRCYRKKNYLVETFKPLSNDLLDSICIFTSELDNLDVLLLELDESDENQTLQGIGISNIVQSCKTLLVEFSKAVNEDTNSSATAPHEISIQDTEESVCSDLGEGDITCRIASPINELENVVSRIARRDTAHSLCRAVVIVALWDKKEKEIVSVGSGFVVDSERGLIVTASHVVIDMEEKKTIGDCERPNRSFGKHYYGLERSTILIGMVPSTDVTNQRAKFVYSASIIESDVENQDACVLRIATELNVKYNDEDQDNFNARNLDIGITGSLIKRKDVYDIGLPTLNVCNNASVGDRIRLLGYKQDQMHNNKKALFFSRSIDVRDGKVCQEMW